MKIYVANFQCTKCKARFYSVVYIGGKDRPTAYESQCPDCRQWNGTTDLTEVTDERQVNQLISTISRERRTDSGYRFHTASPDSRQRVNGRQRRKSGYNHRKL